MWTLFNPTQHALLEAADQGSHPRAVAIKLCLQLQLYRHACIGRTSTSQQSPAHHSVASWGVEQPSCVHACAPIYRSDSYFVPCKSNRLCKFWCTLYRPRCESFTSTAAATVSSYAYAQAAAAYEMLHLHKVSGATW